MPPIVKAGIVALLIGWFLLLNGCATAPPRPPDNRAHWIVVNDAIPNDWRICVPLWEGNATQLQCMWVQDFRAWLRRKQLAD